MKVKESFNPNFYFFSLKYLEKRVTVPYIWMDIATYILECLYASFSQYPHNILMRSRTVYPNDQWFFRKWKEKYIKEIRLIINREMLLLDLGFKRNGKLIYPEFNFRFWKWIKNKIRLAKFHVVFFFRKWEIGIRNINYC